MVLLEAGVYAIPRPGTLIVNLVPIPAEP